MKTGFADIGYVTCIPIGMAEVSSIVFSKGIAVGQHVEKGQEIGYFKFGGSSSFAIIFEDVSKYKKILTFAADHGLGGSQSKQFPTDPPLPNAEGTAGIRVYVGMQIGVIS